MGKYNDEDYINCANQSVQVSVTQNTTRSICVLNGTSPTRVSSIGSIAQDNPTLSCPLD